MTAPANATDDRTCPIPNCRRQLKDGYLMCSRHWFKVPMQLRSEVWRTWKAWQKDFADTAAMNAWRKAADNAIGSIP